MHKKKLFLVENVVDSGGNRVIAIKIFDAIEKGYKVDVAVTQRVLTKPKDIAGLIKDILTSKIKYKKANKVFLLNKPIATENYDEVISTGKRSLLFIENISAKNHLHLFQHVETWGTLNSNYFSNLCKINGYPNGAETIKAINENKIISEQIYLYNLSFINKAETVSYYLKDILVKLNPKMIVKVCEPPEIGFINNKISNMNNYNYEYDLLFFIRGLKFKGDDLHMELIRYFYKDGLKICVVCSKSKNHYNFNNKDYINSNFKFKPSDLELNNIYKKTKIFVNCSVSEGFGATVREAYNNNMHCVASNVGWIQKNELKADQRLLVVKKHNISNYIKTIETLLKKIKD
jgi:hypothetical protein